MTPNRNKYKRNRKNNISIPKVLTARVVALKVLLQRLRDKRFTEELLAANPDFHKLSPLDRHLTQELVYGVIRWQKTLDWLIMQVTEGKQIKKPVLQIIRLGLYQLFWLDKIPEHAAVFETTELTKQFGFNEYAALVNAIMRRYCREKEQTIKALEELKHTDLPTGYSHPKWLVDRWITRYGFEQTIQLLQWNNNPPPTYARVNTLRTTPSRLIERWREEEVDYDFCYRDWLPENLFFEIRSPARITELGSWKDGWFYIQDPSTYLAVKALDPKPGQRILDLCAAPGGKTTLIAQIVEDSASILALDVDKKRLQKLEENCVRLGIQNVVTGELPPKEEGEAPAEGLFDRVLVDVPCSNTGVLRRRVDLRWRIQPVEIEQLCRIQLELLNRSSLVIKPGGVLVYSTCSLESEENRQVIENFLKNHPDFTLDWEKELFPPSSKTDGAYVARLLRKEDLG